jgi:hypothetical protein
MKLRTNNIISVQLIMLKISSRSAGMEQKKYRLERSK